VRTYIKWVLWVLAIVVVAIAFTVWRHHSIEVDAHVMQRGTAIQAVYATGTVEPSISVPIAPRVAGRLVELKVDEGDVVRKGQILARLEDADLQHQVDQFEAQERWAKQVYDRAETILNKGVGTAADRDKALADWQAAQAATKRGREQQNFMLLVSPDNGVVIRRDGEIGQYIAVNQALMYLATKAPLRISADVDEEDIALIKVGQAVSIHADAFPDKVFTGNVTEVTPKGDTTTRSYRVRIGLPADTPLRIGMTTDTNIIVEQHDQVALLPATAIVNDHSTNFVWVLRNNALHRVEISVGINGERKTEVVKGLNADDLVIDVPLATFKEGQKVKLKQSFPSPSMGKG
jgi:RND family efflux transporter MFP subunit